MVTNPTNSRAPEIPAWLREEYPFAPRSFTTPRGARMSFLDVGPRSDEAVLMLHGNPTWSFYYRKLVQALSPTLRCVVPDHIGMGLSEKPEHYDYSLATRISDIAACADVAHRVAPLTQDTLRTAINFAYTTPGFVPPRITDSAAQLYSEA